MSSSCCQTGNVPSDRNVTSARAKNGSFCTLRAKNAVVDNLHVNSINQSFPVSGSSYIYLYSEELGEENYTGIYLSYSDGTETNLADARRFSSPASIKSLHTNFIAAPDGAVTIGFLSIQIADLAGNALPGVDNPGFIQSPPPDYISAVSTHTLASPLPPNTPFLIRLQQTGTGDRESACTFVINAEIC